MRICVLGLGYIGLPTALLFATHGHKVVGVDINKKLLNLLSEGKTPFNEKGLGELMQDALKSGSFSVSSNIEKSDVFIIAVPTPLDPRNKIAELKYVKLAAEMIAPILKKNDAVILESTVPPGTCEKLLIHIFGSSGLKAGIDYYLAHCPERAVPGNTIYEMINNDRVIGGINDASAIFVRDVYSCFSKGQFYLTNIRTAEFVKLMENTFRDINIALANEFAQIAEDFEINIWDAIKLANRHPRVNILNPGPGVGGHCIAIDPWFLRSNPNKSKIITLAREINDNMPNHLFNLVSRVLTGIDNPMITVLGVAYKKGVNDTRETPALKFIKLAENEGFRVKVHDPFVEDFDYPILGIQDAINDTDCIVIITDHDEFKKLNPEDIYPLVRNKYIVDARNLIDIDHWRENGFFVTLLGNGRKTD